MSRNARRTLITFVVVLVAFGAVLAVMKGQGRTKPLLSAPPSPSPTAAASQTAPTGSPSANTTPAPATGPASSVPTISTQPQSVFVAVAPESDFGSRAAAPQPLGSLDPREQSMQLVFTRNGAGISAIRFSDIWETAEARRQAEGYFKSLGAGEPIDDSKLDTAARFLLQSTLPYYWSGKTFNIPVIGAHSIVVNGTSVNLLSEAVWSETAAGTFQTRIVDASGTAVLEITRQFIIERNFDIALKQTVRNLSDAPVQVKWQQYGPVELNVDKSGYIDRRRFEFGYLPKPMTNPEIVLADDSSLRLERSDVIKAYVRSLDPGANQLQERRLWPNKTSVAQGYGLSWFSSNSRYFGLAIHPLVDGTGAGNRSLSGVVEEVRLDVSGHGGPDERVFTFLVSPLVTIAPGGEGAFNMGVYAGPLDRHVLKTEPYSSLAMNGLIVYQMSSCCSFLTFQWLAKFLLGFLSLLHDYVVFDWGLAIIGLVIVVRTMLHPLTRKSQISMQRFGKQMSAMKPEIDKLQKKYPNDPKRVQQEQMALMREHGVNPLQMLGCLPLFLQTPIWIALWAMLYLAFDIRQQPAFYGVFQHFGWAFLGDLSSQDFFWRLSGNGFVIPLLNAHITSINILPLLMGVVFFLQQKYLTPPPTPNMTPEQIQQQRIMKWMTVVMMPMFLYQAPCGLTLYMVTSSCIGILESRYIRRHITELELNPPPKKESRLAKLRDPLARAYAKRLEEAKRGKDEPPKSFKKRK